MVADQKRNSWNAYIYTYSGQPGMSQIRYAIPTREIYESIQWITYPQANC